MYDTDNIDVMDNMYDMYDTDNTYEFEISMITKDISVVDAKIKGLLKV